MPSAPIPPPSRDSRFSPRLAAFLATWLAPLAGCEELPLFPPTLDDSACLTVEIGEACPSPSEAEAQLVGNTTCEDPVREIISTGDLISEQDVFFTVYGGTTEASDSGAPLHECCYEAAYNIRTGESCTIGRPLMVDGEMVSAQDAERSDWSGHRLPDADGLSSEARRALAQLWTQHALLEHASVPAFARVVLELTALGAPADLVRRTVAATADEVEHASACFALASAYADRPVGPGPLPVPEAGAIDLARLAVETFREGCVGETLAVAVAVAQRHEATDPAVLATLDRIIEDESEHAALAWDIVRWAIQAGGTPVREAVNEAVASLGEPTPDETAVPTGAAAHGMATPGLLRRATSGMLRDVILPEARDLAAV